MFLVSWPGGDWQTTAKIVAALIIVYVAAIWLALVFWTYRDIRQRSRDPVMQTVAVLLVLLFFLPGHWIYLVVRPRYTLTELYERSLEEEALLQELEDQKACPNCRRRVRDEFLICPSCRAQLKEPCRSCGKPLSYAWLACPYCGLEKPSHEGVGARPARAPGRQGGRAPQRTAAQRAPAPPQTATPQTVPATAVVQTQVQPVEGPQQRRESAPPTPSRDPFAPRTKAVHTAGDDSSSPVIGGE
jgi:RNA polymerase subunit RPABC4/transcription elongation factor Spt4